MRRFLLLVLPLIVAGASHAQTPATAGAPPPNSDDSVVKLDQVQVSATQEQTQLNSVDRKIYEVKNDLQATGGSVADVLQNVPGLQVDIDGNVSIRGDSSVQILIDGRSNAQMDGPNRADVLSQMPADSIERIEVLTTPGANYKADGTGGIINIILKKKRTKGASGTARVTVGNDRRYGLGVLANYNPGPFNLYGSYNMRQDDRPRYSDDRRFFIDPVTLLPAETYANATEYSRPIFQITQLGLDYNAAPHDKLSEVLDFTYKTFVRHALQEETSSEQGALILDYARFRFDPEREGNFQTKSTYVHDFGSPNQTLLLEFRATHRTETEDNHYGTLYLIPAQPGGPENILFKTNEPGTEGTAEYTSTFGSKGSFELGLDRWETQSHMDTLDEVTDPLTGLVSSNPEMTNKFYLDETVSAFYATAQDSWGRFGASGGFRLEQAEVATDQITSGVTNDTRYGRLYPSVHLTYDLSDTQQLQLNYSHRVHRPDFEDLNPYPRYYDPYNYRLGNASLKPEEVHSIEAGYQYKQDETTYLATLYYRYTFNAFTTISQYVNSTTLVTTEENLGESKSGGLELATTQSPLPKLTINLSGDVFHNEIDASNLGYSGTKSAINWSGKLSTSYAWTKATSFQLDTNYTARRLTPQGYYAPRFVANFGVKHEFKDRKFILVFTISDLFNSLKEETILNTPTLTEDSTRHRSARIMSLGLIYNFGLSKKPKSEKLQFDNSM